MALVFADRVKETSTTTGTGTYDLAGTLTGYQTFVAGIGTTNTCYYCATNDTDWEVGIGTVTDAAPDTLARTTILASSNADAAVSWGAGTKTIFCTIAADSIAFDTYTPTLTNVTNVAASTAYLCQWFRIGSMVTVSGKVDIDVTTGSGTQTNLGMSLPVASNFAAAENAGGTAISVTNPQIYGIQADAANDRADFSGQISNVNNLSYAFSFTYRII